MLHYHLYLYDTEFDYQRSPVPGVLHDYFGDQLERARSILAGRTREQVDYAIASLDWMLRQGGERVASKAMVTASEKGECFVNRVKALKDLADDFDIAGQSHFPDATWAEYFAALTIAHILEMLAEENFVLSHQWLPDGVTKQDRQDEFRQRFTIEAALESMEACCYAECLRGEVDVGARAIEGYSAKEKDRISLEKQKAAFERHADTNLALRALTRFYRQKEFSSIAQAVSEFLDNPLNKSLVEHLKASNRYRTLYNGLCDCLQGTRALR